MNLLVSFPSIVEKYAVLFESCFTEQGYIHFKKALSGMIVSENKTLEGINRMFVGEQSSNQSSFNKFFNRQNFDLEQINEKRIAMMQEDEKTGFKTAHRNRAVLIVDNTLLKHYGQCFDNIYNLYDYVNKCYKWSHDLVTVHYADKDTDYPVYYKIWDPPQWDGIIDFLKQKKIAISQNKLDSRYTAPGEWSKYMLGRYKATCKKHPEIKQLYKTKLHIAEDLIRKFCNKYPHLNFPIVLDSGFTSKELCGIITNELNKDYVGGLSGEQKLIMAGSKEKFLKDFVQQLKEEHFDPEKKSVFQKTGYTYNGEKTYFYTYHKNHRIKGFRKKQRLVIAFHKKELTGTPYYVISNRLDWNPSGILRMRRHRWPVETYHQEAKAEGLDEYQVRNFKAIQSYIAFVVVTYSMLKRAVHDQNLLSSIQQRLQTEMGSTLPFLRRLMKAESFVLLVEYIFAKVQQGDSLQQVLQPLSQLIAYT